MKKQSQQGFTLVELSIVLVIIGLLIGGILVAQSMIRTTKIQATTRQLGQFDAAVGNFVDKFKGLPGDVEAFSGDGDGIIEEATAGDSDEYKGEVGNFWNNLSLSGLASDSGGTYAAGAGGVLDIVGNGTNAPAIKSGGNGSTIVAFGAAAQENYYQILNVGATATAADDEMTDGGAATLTPADALAIDSKIDDGIANSGNIEPATVGTDDLGAAGAANCFTTTLYDVANEGNECQLKIRIGSQIGYLQ